MSQIEDTDVTDGLKKMIQQAQNSDLKGGVILKAESNAPNEHVDRKTNKSDQFSRTKSKFPPKRNPNNYKNSFGSDYFDVTKFSDPFSVLCSKLKDQKLDIHFASHGQGIRASLLFRGRMCEGIAVNKLIAKQYLADAIMRDFFRVDTRQVLAKYIQKLKPQSLLPQKPIRDEMSNFNQFNPQPPRRRGLPPEDFANDFDPSVDFHSKKRARQPVFSDPYAFAELPLQPQFPNAAPAYVLSASEYPSEADYPIADSGYQSAVPELAGSTSQYPPAAVAPEPDFSADAVSGLMYPVSREEDSKPTYDELLIENEALRRELLIARQQLKLR